MVCWNHFMHYRYAYVSGNVIISRTAIRVTRYHPPIGPRDPALMRELLRLAFDVGDDTPLLYIDADTVQWIHQIEPDLVLVPDRNHFDYVYRALDLAELNGKKYLKIRSQINKFRKNYRHTVEPITPGNREEIMEFLVKWCESKRCNDNFILAHEVEAVFYAVEHFTKLPLRALLIRVNSQVAAISLFERLNANTALIHFEKGLPEYDEICKVINAETAAVLASEVEYIN